MNLFKKIWTKNFLKAKEPIDKFADDIGGLNGQFSWIKYRNGEKIEQYSQPNTITNLSKSTVIRLLAQGNSSYWRGQIDPTQYSISRMRFGNAPYADHNDIDNLKLHYYDISERCYRDNATESFEFSSAGGRYPVGGNSVTAITGRIPFQEGSDVSIPIVRNPTNFPNWSANANIDLSINAALLGSDYDDYNQENPPSHKTLKVELLNSSLAIIGTVEYVRVYSRYSVNDVGNIATTVTNITPNLLSTDINNHNLKYESPIGTQDGYWRIRFKLGAGQIETVTRVRISFKIGAYNIINSIVPKIGYNYGIGITQTDRYPLGVGSNRDYYDTVTPIYRDSIAGSFIDDYSATFSITMTQTEGNGITNLPVYYTEAFLFNSKDDLFSIIRFPYDPQINTPPKGFSKNSETSYLISWTIKSIL